MYSTAFLMGGLGNQMFQIANAYAQSLENNIDCVFRPISQTPHQGKNTIEYVSNIFRNLNFVTHLNNYQTYYEPNWYYEKKNISWITSIEFYGYYQSSKNFLGYNHEIKNLFSIDETTKNFLIKKYPNILLDDTLSLHVRRGDYKKFPDIHPSISKSYIKSALNKIGNYSNIFVFSDDKEWVIKNIELKNATFVEENDYIELWLMSLCKNNILSNSSFSWWGAFLNENKNKKVISPSMWFGPKGPKNYFDIFENEWQKLDVVFNNGELITK